MPAQVAALVFVGCILGLFWFGREQNARTSAALWLPSIWLVLASSRTLGQWLHLAPPIDSAGQMLDGSPFDMLVYSSLIAGGVVVLAARRRRSAKLISANFPVIFFFVYCLASVAWSDFPTVAFKRWVKATGDLVMVFIVWSEIDPAAAVRRLFTRTAFLLVPLSILFIKYYSAWGRTYGRWQGEVHYTGVTTNKNALGALCFLCGFAALWQIVNFYRERHRSDRKRILLANGAVLGMVLWLLVKSNSMTSFVCFAIAAMSFGITRARRIRKNVWLGHFLVSLMLAGTVSALLGGMDSVLKLVGRNPTLTGRTDIWNVLLGLVNNRYVGTGYESFWLGPRLSYIWGSAQIGAINEAHSGYLEIFLNLGWVGVSLLAVVIISGYRRVWRAYRNSVPTANLLLAYFIAGVAYNLTEAAFFRALTPVWIAVLLAATSEPEVLYPSRYSGQTITVI